MIAIYSRKSKFTGKGESIANQIELCRQYIDLHFRSEEYIIFEDEGFSGKNTDRPQFKAMMQEIEKGNIDKIVCYRLDRISRNMSDFVKLIDRLNDKGVQFISVNEQFDTTIPMGKAMMYISSIFSQLERETIAERIRDNLMELAKTGRWLGGITPTGYRSVEIQNYDIKGKTKKAHKLEIMEDEAEIIRLIYNKYLELGSFTQLEKYLINQDIKTKNNIYYSRFALKAILTNPVYAIADEDSYEYFEKYDIFAQRSDFDGSHGVIAYNKTKQSKKKTKVNPVEDWVIAVGEHKGIISGCDWVNVQGIINNNSQKAYRKPRVNQALLGGIIYCSCGSRMGPKMNRSGTFSYACRLKLKSSKCQSENINGIKLDDYIIKVIKGLEADNMSLIGELEKSKKYIKGEKKDNSFILRKRLKSNRDEISSLVSKLANVKNSSAEKYIIERINALDADNADIKAKISQREDAEKAYKIAAKELEAFKKRVADFSACVDNMTYDEKREAIRALINKVIWDGSNIEIHFATKDVVTVKWNNMLEIETNNKLRYYRLKKGYIQKEAAEYAGITLARYKKYEIGAVFCPADVLVKIAEALEMEFSEVAEEYHYFQLKDNQRELIKKAREALGLNKSQFAKLIGVDRNKVYKWENQENTISRKDYYNITKYIKLI